MSQAQNFLIPFSDDFVDVIIDLFKHMYSEYNVSPEEYIALSDLAPETREVLKRIARLVELEW